MHIDFKAPELQPDGSLEEHAYSFQGNPEDGWHIGRDGDELLQLGAGYTAVEPVFCGVCSTDLARQYLPYPLPQIIGHEVVARKDGQFFAVEINASEKARGIHNPDNPWSADSMHTQDPGRITLGIDRLPGGFAPYMLAPREALIPLPQNVDPLTASLTEPFAAALQAVEASAPQNGESIAVLGPRRLGSLLIAALVGYRQQKGLDFEIIAVGRHATLLERCRNLGADRTVLLDASTTAGPIQEKFDLVFDTTGNPAGFELAVTLARRALHVKSTNGQAVAGLTRLTDLVVDEMALLPCKPANLAFGWSIEKEARQNRHIFASPATDGRLIDTLLTARPDCVITKDTIPNMARALFVEGPYHRPEFLKHATLPRFDLALANSLAEVDQILRPIADKEWSLVRARGAILLTEQARNEGHLAAAILDRGLELHSSRCGDFQRALRILAEQPELALRLHANLITHQFDLSEIKAAFAVARDSAQSVKVIVRTNPA
ncbi:MAG: threonine dehydrogenase [Leptospiraceae bacterium]|nr:threonine dehydrogenase [Leptospiraceae bacterium]